MASFTPFFISFLFFSFSADLSLEELESRLEEVNERTRRVKETRLKLQHFRRTLDSLGEEWLVIQNEEAKEQQALEDSLASVSAEIDQVTERLQTLMRVNPLNDAFFIWYEGPFATINGFRLGRLPSFTVEWAETNAALGECALCLTSVANRARFSFTKYVIYPMGAFTKLGRVEEGRPSLNLFTDGTFFLFPKRNFNSALSAFLTCLQEFGEYIEDHDPVLQLPYSISLAENKIGDLSVLYTGNEDEKWTRALKFLLTNLKWIVAWASKHLQACS